LDEYLYLQLKQWALGKKMSLSAAIRELAARQLLQEKHVENPLLGLAKLGKKFKMKGPPDLAVNHDYYLYGRRSSSSAKKKLLKR